MGCYANPNPIFQRAMRIVTAITNSNPASVTTSFAHQYMSGLIVRLIIPLGVGMEQMNQMTGTITVTSPTTFLINIDSTYFDTFVIPAMPPSAYTCAQVIPIAEINSILTEATQNVLNNT